MANTEKAVNIIKLVLDGQPDFPAKSRKRIDSMLDSLTAEAEPKAQITQLSVIGTDENHTIFGLGTDGKPYVWDGKWVIHG